jgi:hypothetical protein
VITADSVQDPCRQAVEHDCWETAKERPSALRSIVNVNLIALAAPVGDGGKESSLTLSDDKSLDVDVPFHELARLLRPTER